MCPAGSCARGGRAPAVLPAARPGAHRHHRHGGPPGRATGRPAVTSLCLDASAITKLIIEEPESSALRERVRGSRLFSSRIAVVEVTKAVARANPDADPQPMLARLGFVELGAELARLAASTGVAELRALDAIHLASAVRLGREVAALLTYDDRQARAAEALGISVESPAATG